MTTAGVLFTLSLLAVLIGDDVRRVSAAKVRPGLRELRDGRHPDSDGWTWTRAATLLLALVSAGLMLPVMWGLLT